jgi:translocation and assembly module TamA
MARTARRFPPLGRRPVRRLFASLLTAAAMIALPASAADSESTEHFDYRVTIVAPASLKETLARDVGLVRWQDYAEMTKALFDRLAREAIEETRNAAAAEGWFSAEVDVKVDNDVKPAAVTLAVKEGPLTRVSGVQLRVTGPAETDVPLGTDAIAKLEREWLLPAGEVFRQGTWAAAKEKALATLTASPYAAAQIERSEAYVDPEKQTADLTVVFASGPPFRFGHLEISGLEKYTAPLVRNFNTIEAGEPYSAEELVRYVRRLNASGYFASAQAAVDTDPKRADAAAVKVAVIEAPPKRFEGGVGYSTDVQFRADATYRDVNVNGRGLQMLLDGRLETKLQSGTIRFTQPPNDAHWIGAWSAEAKRTDIEDLVTKTVAIGTRWHEVEERNQTALSLTFYVDEQQPTDAPYSTSHALYGEYERYWRRVDNLIAPTAGWMASAQAGGGVPGVSTRGFGRVIGRFDAWYPVSPLIELEFRAQGGAVLSPTRDGIPSVLLFRTGGDTTVRGYAFESLGVQQGSAVVPGRYYAVFNAEATRWIGEAWGIAAFVDAGNATDSLTDFHLALGYGAGVRVRTPVGPFRLDLAYGQDVHQFRVHFSVGITF